MKTLRGPGIFLAQFISEEPPFNTFDGLCEWVSKLGYRGIQVPVNHPSIFDVELAATSDAYLDEIRSVLRSNALEITELSTHLEGQLLAAHPAYDTLFARFAPPHLANDSLARRAWAKQRIKHAIRAGSRLGLKNQAAFSGSLAWPYFYPWPQRPTGLIEAAFEELAKRWKPILDDAGEHGIHIAFELHPGEDLFDGLTFERFLDAVNQHQAARILYDPSHFLLQQMDYLGFIDTYHERIGAFHVKDAEFNPSAKAGIYGGYADWLHRPGRFRSLGDGQIDFSAVFSRLTAHGFDGWAVMEWECCLKSAAQGAREGAPFIASHIIEATKRAFDDFAGAELSQADLRSLLGI